MKIKLLNTTHPERDADQLLDYQALYEGGKVFRGRVGRFLLQNPQEPGSVYIQRKAEAPYRSYIGSIVGYFASLLMTGAMNATAKVAGSDSERSMPEWYRDMERDIDGAGTPAKELWRKSVTDVQVKKQAILMLDFPETFGEGGSLAEADRIGGTDVKLRRLRREQLLDWSRDSRGVLEFVIAYETECPRENPEAERTHELHRWHVMDREKVRIFEALVAHGKTLDEAMDLQPTREIVHGLGEVPLVEMSVDDALWVADRLESPQLEHFRLTAANDWSMRRTAYAMPIFNLQDPSSFNPVMGAGYYLKIGIDEKASFLAPPTGHIVPMANEIKAQKDEIYRLVLQMALGTDNSAGTVGRSAASKVADAEATQIILSALAERLRGFIQRALDLLSKARGEPLEWSVEGFNKHDAIPVGVIIELLSVDAVREIPSETFQAEFAKRAAMGMLPGVDAKTRDEIKEEIEVGATVKKPSAPEPRESKPQASEALNQSEPEEPKETDDE